MSGLVNRAASMVTQPDTRLPLRSSRLPVTALTLTSASIVMNMIGIFWCKSFMYVRIYVGIRYMLLNTVVGVFLSMRFKESETLEIISKMTKQRKTGEKNIRSQGNIPISFMNLQRTIRMRTAGVKGNLGMPGSSRE